MKRENLVELGPAQCTEKMKLELFMASQTIELLMACNALLVDAVKKAQKAVRKDHPELARAMKRDIAEVRKARKQIESGRYEE